MRVAFYGRVSTDDAQDPSLSIPRQLGKCDSALELIGEKVSATYWDVESGRKALDERGNGKRDWTEDVAVPRMGGLPDLVRSAQSGEIDIAIVESIDRIARMTGDSTRIESELAKHDVALFAADEPLNTSATTILTRRVKQGVAEWYVRDLIERSRAGMEESVRQGWHTGGPPPYGYMLEPHPHPNPQKAREGKHKHRLVVDPEQAPIVLMIFTWYCLRGLGLGAICDKLNRDLDRYPPPKRNRKDENNLIQTWSRSQLHSMLRNPKYTGYNVWNRHDKRPGRPHFRPRKEWIWSPEPTHEAIVSRELFDQVDGRARNNEASSADQPQPRRVGAHSKQKPQAKRLYVLRGRLYCGICGRRMEGSHQKGHNWMRCQYVSKRGEAAAEATGHPKVLGLKEVVVLDPLREFMAKRLFGPDRLDLLRAELVTAAAGDDDAGRENERSRLEDEKKKVDQGLRQQLLLLEEHDDPGHPVVRLAKERIAELSGQAESLAFRLLELEREKPSGPTVEEIEAVLADTPNLTGEIAAAEGEDLVDLLTRFDVRITYDKPGRSLEISATVGLNLPSENEPEKTTATRPNSDGSQVLSIAGERVGLNGARPAPIEWVADFAPQAGLRRSD